MTGEPCSVRSALRAVYLPALVFEVGIGAVLPVIALSATALGASLPLAGFVVALLAVGQIVGDVPAGALAARIGDRRAMLVAAGLSVVALSGAALARDVVVLGVCVLGVGATNAVFTLARHSYLTEVTPVLRRARALSTLAGVQRIGTFIGPFVGAGVIHLSDVRSAYWLAVLTSVSAAVVILLVPDVVQHTRALVRVPLRRVLRDHRQVFVTLGLAVMMVGAVRGSRQTVLPLWSEHLGLSPATTSIVFGISGGVDMLLFYPAGKVMDRYGRLWIGIPSMLALGVGFALLPLTTSLGSLTAVAVLIGLGNGMGSGVLMTLGADVAPPGSRAQFLGIWRLLQDAGGAGGPLLVAAGAALGSLATGIAAMAVVSAGSAAGLARWGPRWSVHANRTTRRRAREAGLLD
ncbi:MFS transporter [Actinotalea sp. K2]|uniref:MFS transporter n=1 Tax=Actinotalea sp. K2 TaxID=2939438 RepID=UPI002016F48B|nr:MFS transporter [Actinotalea sp. K2]MCL3861534.1 MFS transporter [Actinotalea sp. K2]